jgi:hypothetical protein
MCPLRWAAVVGVMLKKFCCMQERSVSSYIYTVYIV